MMRGSRDRLAPTRFAQGGQGCFAPPLAWRLVEVSLCGSLSGLRLFGSPYSLLAYF